MITLFTDPKTPINSRNNAYKPLKMRLKESSYKIINTTVSGSS